MGCRRVRTCCAQRVAGWTKRSGSHNRGSSRLIGGLAASAAPVTCARGGGPRLAPLVLGGELARTSRLRDAVGMSVSAPTRITLRKEQHVLADRMELLIAERADVGRRLQVLCRTHVPPPKGILVGHPRSRSLAYGRNRRGGGGGG